MQRIPSVGFRSRISGICGKTNEKFYIQNEFKDKIEIYEEEAKNSSKTLLYYQDAVLSELSKIDKIPDSLIKSGGLKIYTEYDSTIQNNLENAINNNMKDDSEEVAALYINPLNGGVNALVGGKNYNKSSYF